AGDLAVDLALAADVHGGADGVAVDEDLAAQGQAAVGGLGGGGDVAVQDRDHAGLRPLLVLGVVGGGLGLVELDGAVGVGADVRVQDLAGLHLQAAVDLVPVGAVRVRGAGDVHRVPPGWWSGPVPLTW